MMIEGRQNQYSPVGSTPVMNKTSLLLAITIRDRIQKMPLKKARNEINYIRLRKPFGEIIII